MNRNSIFAAAVGAFLIISIVVFGGCKGTLPGSDISTDLSTILTLSTVSYDFGLIEAEAGSDSISVAVTNDGAETVILSQAKLTDPVNFTADDSVFPLTLEPGDTAALLCIFNPMESGSLETTIEINAEDYDTSLTAILTGEGNYPPEIVPGIFISGDPDISGFYAEEGSYNGRPVYISCQNNGFAIYYFGEDTTTSRSLIPTIPDGGWVIHSNDFSLGSYNKAFCFSYDDPAPSTPAQVQEWSIPITVTDNTLGPLVCGADVSACQEGEAVHVEYIFSDKDSDAEGASQFQWYQCSNPDDTGTAITGATEREYLIQSEDAGCYLRVTVLPEALTGIIAGPSYTSQSTARVMFGM